MTQRELEVLRLIADGYSNRQIAEHLFITEGTAGTHVSNILGKLGVRGRTEAAALAHRMETAGQIRGLKPWITNEYEHNGLRADGERVLGRLIDLVRGRA